MNDAAWSEADYQRGLRMLRERRYDGAWRLYELRRQFDPVVRFTTDARQPEWRGEPLDGKVIVIRVEQGLGDQLMFGRYLQALKARGAQVVIACDPRVIGSVFYFAGFEVTPLYADRRLYDGDFWAPIGSLPFLLGASAPPPPVWAQAEASRVGGVGVVAAGNPKHANDRNRSLWGADAQRLLAFGRDLRPAEGGPADLSITAQTMASLDLVVTVDTAVAHLAGSFGVPCWVLLPQEGLDWRWNDGVRSDWYPETRLFRQSAPGDWASVLDVVERELCAAALR